MKTSTIVEKKPHAPPPLPAQFPVRINQRVANTVGYELLLLREDRSKRKKGRSINVGPIVTGISVVLIYKERV